MRPFPDTIELHESHSRDAAAWWLATQVIGWPNDPEAGMAPERDQIRVAAALAGVVVCLATAESNGPT